MNVDSSGYRSPGGGAAKERDLRIGRDTLAAMLEALPTAVTVKDADDRLLLVNSAAEELLGVPASALLGLATSDYLGPETDRTGRDEDRFVLTTGVALTRRRSFDVPRGPRRELALKKARVFDLSGKPLLLTVMDVVRGGPERAEDVDPREPTQLAPTWRDAQSTLMQSVLDVSDVASWSVDRTYRYTSFNTAHAESMRQRNETRVELGKRVQDCVDPEDWAWILRNLDRALSGETVVENTTVAAGSTQEACFETRYVPVRSETAEVIGAAVFSRDVTDRDVLSRQLRELEARVGHLQTLQNLGRMVSGVAHDLNNLLSIIFAAAGTIDTAEETTASTRTELESILGAALRARALTSQFLSLSRRQPSLPAPCDVSERIKASHPLLRHLAGTQVSMCLKLNASHQTALVDPHLFDQALMNLVVNARDALPPGGVLTLRTEDAVVVDGVILNPPPPVPRTHVAVSVEDNGLGMAPDVLRRVFEPFFTTKPPGQGTGLGLSLVKSAVERMGGALGVESEPGRGTTFTFALPLVSEPLATSK